MARNGSGQYNLPTSSWYPPVNGVLATAGDWQALIEDVAAALTQSLSRDGQTPMTGNQAMGGNKLTGLGAGTATGDSLRWQQLFDQGIEEDIASAAVMDIGARNSNFLRVTGGTTITGLGTNYKGPRFLRFEGAVTITNSASLILPNGQNYTTAAGDVVICIPKATLGTPDGWYVVKASGAISTSQIANGAVTTDKLANGAVATDKLANGAATGAKLGSDVVVTSGNQTIGGNKSFTGLTGFQGHGGNLEIKLGTGDGATQGTYNNAIKSWWGLAFQGYDNTVSRVLDCRSGAFSSFAEGTTTFMREFSCRAWVNFNGTGTVAIRASGNVSSITDNGTGDYTVNFATAMPDANYAGFITQNNSSGRVGFPNTGIYTASQVQIAVRDGSGNLNDISIVDVAIFR